MDTWTIIIIVGGLAFYFLPILIAMNRNCLHSGAIGVINTFFGWTILGWIAALIWAIVEAPRTYKRA